MVFPSQFLWGAATAANQCEGAYNVDGRGISAVDILTSGTNEEPRLITPQLRDDLRYPNHDAVNFFHHYKEDIALMAEMGLKAYRFSISWSRIYPKGVGKLNEKGLEFYDNIIRELLKYKIDPIITLSHYEMPFYLIQKYNGWYSRELILIFEKYCKTVMSRYKGQVKYWLTFNEINAGSLQVGNYLSLGILDKKTVDFSKQVDNPQLRFQALHHQLVASAKVVKMGHEINPDFKIGCMLGLLATYPLTCDPNDVIKSQHWWQEINYYCGDVHVRGEYGSYCNRIWDEKNVSLDITDEDREVLKEGTVDFFSISYYMTNCVSCNDNQTPAGGNLINGVANPYLKQTEWGWQIDPNGLRYTLNELYGRYQLPIMIVENGLGTVDTLEEGNVIHDDYRINYLREHIQAMANAINDGVDLIGYTLWSCFDIISASSGEMKKRYGLIYVDLDNEGNGTMNRYKKDSFYWYKNVIESNGNNTV